MIAVCSSSVSRVTIRRLFTFYRRFLADSNVAKEKASLEILNSIIYQWRLMDTNALMRKIGNILCLTSISGSNALTTSQMQIARLIFGYRLQIS